MKVLVLHNAYQKRGGEDAVVEQEVNLLRSAGHSVHLELVDNDAISGTVTKLRVFWNTPFDQGRHAWMQQLLTLHRPDVVHVHNFFPLLTPAVHQAASEAGVAVIQTLHNFRTVCAGALLLRNGTICEKCLAGSRQWGIVHRCYRGSLAGSLAVVRMQQRADSVQAWHRHVHRFIALSNFAKSKLTEGGVPHDRLVVKPNFVAKPPSNEPAERTEAVFLGRLSPEKGVKTLIEAWRSIADIPLTIAGAGPDEDGLRAQAPQNVRFVGQLQPENVHGLLRRAKFLVIPSIWYEGFPMVLLEAFSLGVPVVASDIGSLGELIQPGINGALFAPGDAQALVGTVRSLLEVPGRLEELGVGAQHTYANLYTPEKNLARLEEVYGQALEEARTPASQPAHFQSRF